jgi:hypothetical protein
MIVVGFGTYAGKTNHDQETARRAGRIGRLPPANGRPFGSGFKFRQRLAGIFRYAP